jgi:hypothetical protein
MEGSGRSTGISSGGVRDSTNNYGQHSRSQDPGNNKGMESTFFVIGKEPGVSEKHNACLIGVEAEAGGDRGDMFLRNVGHSANDAAFQTRRSLWEPQVQHEKAIFFSSSNFRCECKAIHGITN